MFGLLAVLDEGYHTQRYGERSRQRLDLAMVSFFQCFRKVYIGEQVGGRAGGGGQGGAWWGWARRERKGGTTGWGRDSG